MEETNTPMFKSARPMESQMDEILSETKDPVSGNTAPVGSMPEEVRDDIPIMASPNEFMNDAATRRYYGTEFFEGLQDAAKQGFQRIKKGEESFFRDDELEIEEAAEKVTSGGSPQQMNEGGGVDTIEGREIPAPVGGGFGAYGGTGPMFTGFEYKIYIDTETGRELTIIFFNGRPLSPIPEGYVLKADTPVEVQEQKAEVSSGSGGGGGDKPDPVATFRNTPVDKWTNDMFKNYSSSMQDNPNAGQPSAMEKGLLFTVGNAIVPGGGFALTRIASKQNNKIAQQVVDKVSNYLKTGKDSDGNELSTADLDMYNTARINANFAIMNTRSRKNIFDFTKRDPFASDSQEAKDIIAQQQAYVQTLRDRDDDDSDDDDGGPGIFYGGTEATETALIQDESLTDDEFFEEFEKGTPGGVGNVYGN